MVIANTAFLDACQAKRPAQHPVWFMRQAGRSLPEYNAIRGTGSILEAIKHPDLVTEITLQPVRRYGVDAAVLYSDIMVPLHAIGFGVDIVSGTGPVVEQPFTTDADLARLVDYLPDHHSPYLRQSIEMLVKELDVPLIGFCGAPFTLAAYLIEGGPSRQFLKTKTMMHARPDLWRLLMERLVEICTASLQTQVDAGCSAIQIFDSWAGALGPDHYRQLVMPYTNQILRNLAATDAIKVNFGTGTGEFLADMAAEADVVGVDWRVRLADARQRVGNKALQGNLDPALCFADWQTIESEAAAILSEAGASGHVFNLGHGVLPQTNPDVLARLVDFVHQWNHDR